MAKRPTPRDPAKHSKKDPAKPTRAKASRPDVPAMDSSLADILNPALSRGRAGIGAQTGIEAQKHDVRTPSPFVGREGGGAEQSSTPTLHRTTPTPNPSPQGEGENAGLQPP